MAFRRLIVALALVGVALPLHPSGAAEVTTCPFGSPTPGYQAARLDLPEGTSFLSIEPHGGRSGRPVNGEESWHLSQGLVIVNASTLELEAYRVEVIGTAPHHIVARAGGTEALNQAIPGPDGPFYHTTSRSRAGLPAGTYYVVGFGSDGSEQFPNDWWGADVRVGGQHRCVPVGRGEVFEFDNADFVGETQIYAQAAGYADEITYEHTTSRQLVVGLMDAGVQLAGEAELAYDMPSIDGVVDDEIQPFATLGGTSKFEASYSGVFPMILVTGVALDI